MVVIIVLASAVLQVVSLVSCLGQSGAWLLPDSFVEAIVAWSVFSALVHFFCSRVVR